MLPRGPSRAIRRCRNGLCFINRKQVYKACSGWDNVKANIGGEDRNLIWVLRLARWRRWRRGMRGQQDEQQVHRQGQDPGSVYLAWYWETEVSSHVIASQLHERERLCQLTTPPQDLHAPPPSSEDLCELLYLIHALFMPSAVTMLICIHRCWKNERVNIKGRESVIVTAELCCSKLMRINTHLGQ